MDKIHLKQRFSIKVDFRGGPRHYADPCLLTSTVLGRAQGHDLSHGLGSGPGHGLGSILQVDISSKL